jgi:hypothetical protein
MIFDHLVFYWQEGADSHVQRQRMNGNPFPLDFIEKRFCEMQPSRRGRYGPFPAGINGLVTLQIPNPHSSLAIPPNVRGERRKTNPPQGPTYIPVANQAQPPKAMGNSPQEFTAKSLFEKHNRPVADLAGTLHQAFPLTGSILASPIKPGPGFLRPLFPHQEDFNFPPALLFADQAGGPDFCVIGHQDIPRLQIFRQLVKTAMIYGSRSPVKNHQPRMIPRVHGLLSNQPWRKMVIEVLKFHRIAEKAQSFADTTPLFSSGNFSDIYVLIIIFQDGTVIHPFFSHSFGPPLTQAHAMPPAEPRE